MILAACALAAYGADLFTSGAGYFDDGATWGGNVPVAGDNLLINGAGHDVVLTNAFTAGTFQSYVGSLEIDSVGSLTGNMQHLNGGTTITGGSLHSTAATVFGQVGATVLTMNGGTALFDGYVLMKGNSATFNLNSGSSFIVAAQLALEGSAVAHVFVNDGADLTVDWVHFQAGGSSEERITVDGGVFNVMTGNAAGSFAFDGTNASVQFDAGLIVWQGINDQTEYNAFVTTFNGWVDAGRINSANWTPAELKAHLAYSGGNAVLSALPKSVLYVSTNGSNGWSGALAIPAPDGSDGPLATLVGARDRIRTLRAGGPLGAVDVLVRGGIYYESPTLVLEPQDSGTADYPVTYKAYPGESPVVSGGRKLGQPSLVGGGRYAVAIPQAAGRQWAFRQLFIDDVRYTLARSPNSGYFYVQGIPPAPPSPYYDEPYWSSHNFIYNPGDLKNWSTLAAGEIDIRVYSLWETGTVLLTSVDESNQAAFTATHMLWGYDPHDVIHPGGISKRYIIENAPDSLDAPGEWYLDRDTGQLTIIPFASEDLSVKTLVAPVTEHAVTIAGDADANSFVEHVRFEDIAFRDYSTPVLTGGLSGGWRTSQAASTIDSCIDISGGNSIEFLRCEISHIGTHAIEFGRGCVSNTVEQCHLYDLGGGGIYLGERVKIAEGYNPGASGGTSHNTLYNNYIHDGGIIHQGAMGIVIGQTSDNLVAHNEIAYFNQSGIQVGWNWDTSSTWTKNNRIRWNHIHDIGQNVSSDLAGIYTVGENLNTLIENNVIHDVYCWVEGNGKGFYPDQNTSGVTFGKNLVYGTGAHGFGINHCRDIVVSNNVFALNYGKAAFNFGNGASTAQITGNIFYNYYGNVYADNNDTFNPAWVSTMDYNLYWRIDGSPVNYAPVDVSFSLWKSLTGLDAHSLEADPMFVDPENGDFSFSNASNANAIGFAAVDWSQSGLEGTPEWVSLPDAFKKNSSYRVYFEEWPGYNFILNGLDAVISVDGFSTVSNGGQGYGALTFRRIKVPIDTGYAVRATSNLVSNEWTTLTNIYSVIDDVITESVTVRDDAPVSAFRSRFYRLAPQ